MPSSQDILFGRVALDLGVISGEQLEECVALQEKDRRPLGTLLVEKGYLTPEQLKQIVATQGRRLSEKAQFSALRKGELLFGTLAVQEKFLTREQLNEALRVQAVAIIHGNKVRLGELLVEQELLTREQVDAILRLQARKADEISLPGYHVVSKLGEGGMGAVYLATQVSMDRPVAIKVLSPELCKDKIFVQRFLTEAKNSARLNHPNIIRGIDVVGHEQHYYYVMEYVEGETLRSILDSGPLHEDKALDITLQVASALQHAEERHLVHRDVKPDNILINEEEVAKLCDLGLSKQAGSKAHLTDAGTLLGTPDYMSPEQARGQQDLDIRSDLYSLGATLYHMLTGQPPFRGKNAVETLRQHLQSAPRPPRDVIEGLSSEIDAVALRLLAKKPEDRYASAAELVKTLKALQVERDKARLLSHAQEAVAASKRAKSGGVAAASRGGPVRAPRRAPQVEAPPPPEAATGEAEEPVATPSRRGKEIALVAVGAAVLVIGAGVLIWGFRGSTGGHAGNVAANNSAVANNAAPPANTGPDLSEVERNYNALVQLANDRPGKERESMAKVREFADANKDNKYGALADLKFIELQRTWDAAAEAALKAAREKARELEKDRRFAEAREAVAAVAQAFPDSTAAAKVSGAVKEVESELRKFFAAQRDAAEKNAKDKEYEKALAAYHDLEALAPDDLLAQAKARIGEIEALIAKREEEKNSQARAAVYAEFDKEVDEIFGLLKQREFNKVSSRYFTCLGNAKLRSIWTEIEAHKKRIEPYFTFWKDVDAGFKKVIGTERVFALADGRSMRGKVTRVEGEMISIQEGVATLGVKTRELAPKEIAGIAMLALDPKGADAHLKCAIYYAVCGDAAASRAELDVARGLGADVDAYPVTLRLEKRPP